jgi:hypothetical protein
MSFTDKIKQVFNKIAPPYVQCTQCEKDITHAEWIEYSHHRVCRACANELDEYHSNNGKGWSHMDWPIARQKYPKIYDKDFCWTPEYKTYIKYTYGIDYDSQEYKDYVKNKFNVDL